MKKYLYSVVIDQDEFYVEANNNDEALSLAFKEAKKDIKDYKERPNDYGIFDRELLGREKPIIIVSDIDSLIYNIEEFTIILSNAFGERLENRKYDIDWFIQYFDYKVIYIHILENKTLHLCIAAP